jgi:integrase
VRFTTVTQKLYRKPDGIGLGAPGDASLSRRAGADLRLLQKAMGHASITVTAHTYADLFDDELDNFAAALDSLPDF